jgi:hypothetical protein
MWGKYTSKYGSAGPFRATDFPFLYSEIILSFNTTLLKKFENASLINQAYINTQS